MEWSVMDAMVACGRPRIRASRSGADLAGFDCL